MWPDASKPYKLSGHARFQFLQIMIRPLKQILFLMKQLSQTIKMNPPLLGIWEVLGCMVFVVQVFKDLLPNQ